MKNKQRETLAGGFIAGRDLDTGQRVLVSAKARETHMQVIGSSGMGKTKFLEHMIREDILARRGLCLIDPTGNLYRHLVEWLAANPDLKRPVILFDPADDEYVTGYNPIRSSAKDVSYRVDEVVRACAKVWGAESMSSTPLLKKCLRLIFSVLAARRLSIVEARHLINPKAADFRSFLASNVAGTLLGDQWEFYNRESSTRVFFEDFASSVNRLIEFLTSPRMERIFGQTENVIDIRQVMDEGGVLLVNLSRQQLSEDAVKLIGTLLVNDFFLTATERPEGSRPFYLYIDECHKFVNEDIGGILDQCRQFGLHVVLSHQHLAQLKDVGEAVYMAVRTNAKVKAIFGGLAPEDAAVLAQQIYMGEFDIDEVKHELHRTLEHHRLQWIDIRTETHSHTSGFGGGSHRGFTASGHESGGDSDSFSESDADGESVTRSPILVPEEDTELSGVQFRSLEEQIHRATSTMVVQPQQQALLKVLNAKTRTIRTPTIRNDYVRPERVRRYEIGRYGAVPFCLPSASAQAAIQSRTSLLTSEFAAKAAADVHSLDREPPPMRPAATSTTDISLNPISEANERRRKSTKAATPRAKRQEKQT